MARARPLFGSVALAALLLGGCGPTDGCEQVCELATPLFERCIQQWGLSWADSGYEGAEDHAAWCATYNLERRLLAETAEDPEGAEAALEERCGGQVTALQSGECAAYWGVFEDAVP